MIQINDTGRLSKCKEEVAASYKIVRAALGGFAKQTAYASVKVFGKRVTPRFVWAQGEPQDTARANFHENYKRSILTYIFAGNVEGARLLMADLEAAIIDALDILGFAPRPLQLDRERLLDLVIIRRKLDFILAV